ncbi:WD repeat-containing protein 86-like [Polyodon spathula]|uniref:WD repeat-containing protein 86-like n=1 Tax=Polyodon spathula TaxID=7913 RepID=UPI001B7E8227|nr:WD repeat-containing protein 86-like [Polyodon spathula]
MSPHAEAVVMGSGSSRSASLRKVCADHCGGVNWLSLSPDGRYLLTGSEDWTARLWSTSEQQCCMLFQGHENYITSCHLENDAAYTCSADHSVRRWDLTTGGCTAVFKGHSSIVNKVLVTQGCLFSASYDRTARCWSVETGRQLQEFRGHRNCVLALAHCSSQDLLPEPDSEQVRDFLITGSTDCTLKLWVVSDGRCYRTLRGHSGAILCLALDTTNKALFSGSTDCTVRRWDLTKGEQTKVFREHQGSIICLELVSQHLYSGSADRTVKCWLLDSGKCVRTFKSHKRTVSAIRYHRGILFTGSGDACARAFDTKSGVLRRVFRGHTFIINCIQIHKQLLYTGSHDGTLRVWDVRSVLEQDKETPKKDSQKGSLTRLCNNKVGCMWGSQPQRTERSSQAERELREQEGIELV